MKVLRPVLLLLVCLCQTLPQPALAHGSVTADGDLCLLQIAFYRAHFKIYQLSSSGRREYCEDLPATGEALFVMEYLHQDLSGVPLEFRILRDPTGLGRFARIEDVQALNDAQIAAATVFHQAASIEPGVLVVRHEFDTRGDYLGIVSVAGQGSAERPYLAVFPFHVGARSWGLLPLFLVLALLAHWGYRTSRGRARQPLLARHAMMLCMLLPLVPVRSEAAAAVQESWLSESGRVRASISSDIEPLPLNRMHGWNLHLESSNGEPLERARIQVSGGMPAHNHGLATAPSVSELDGGDYRIEGLRFHMQGLWVLELLVATADGEERIRLELTL